MNICLRVRHFQQLSIFKNKQKENYLFIFSKCINNVEYTESAVVRVLIIIAVNALFHKEYHLLYL